MLMEMSEKKWTEIKDDKEWSIYLNHRGKLG